MLIIGRVVSPVAVITDIHANLPALESALARIEDLGIERIYCGGDLVGYGPHPNEVCALIEERGIPTIYGNYDYALGRDLTDCGCAYVDHHDRELGQRSVDWTLAHTGPEAKASCAACPSTCALAGRGRRPPGPWLASQGQRVLEENGQLTSVGAFEGVPATVAGLAAS
jgi:Calcineurin-like phosphoesterase superfamily domain